MTTLDLVAAAAFLGIHRETLRERVAAGMIPGAKIGKEWRFLQDDLTAYFRSQCRSFAVDEWVETLDRHVRERIEDEGPADER